MCLDKGAGSADKEPAERPKQRRKGPEGFDFIFLRVDENSESKSDWGTKNLSVWRSPDRPEAGKGEETAGW
jgi:hypothetical protein